MLPMRRCNSWEQHVDWLQARAEYVNRTGMNRMTSCERYGCKYTERKVPEGYDTIL